MDMPSDFGRMPGYTDLGSWTPREIIWIPGGELYLPGGIIDSANAYDGGNTGYVDELRPGWLMAQITTTKKWVPVQRTTVATGTGSVTTCTLVNSYAFQAGQAIKIGTDAVTIDTITYSTHTITWTGAVTIAVADAVIASDVGALAGAQTAKAVLATYVKMKDRAGTLRDRIIGSDPNRALLFQGQIIAGMVLGDLAAVQAVTTSPVLKRVVFDTDYGFVAG